MINFVKHFYKLLIWVFVIAYLSFATSDNFRQVNLSIPHLDKMVHFIMFLILGVLVAAIIYQKRKTFPPILFPLIGILYGGLIEIIQFKFIDTRSGDLLDWFADIFGLVVGLFVFKYLPNIIKSGLKR